MQTDQDEEQSQGDGQNETEEKTTQENEETEVRSLILLLLLLLLKKEDTSLFPVTAWMKPVKSETSKILLLYYAICCASWSRASTVLSWCYFNHLMAFFGFTSDT